MPEGISLTVVMERMEVSPPCALWLASFRREDVILKKTA